MAARMPEGQRVRVANPTARHQHMRGQVGRITKVGNGGTYRVSFLGGKGLFHGSELEPAGQKGGGHAV